MEVNGYCQLVGYAHSSKYLLLCLTEERNSYRFGMTWGWISDDRISIFGWTTLFSEHSANDALSYFTHKWKLFHYLLFLMSFQTCMTFIFRPHNYFWEMSLFKKTKVFFLIHWKSLGYHVVWHSLMSLNFSAKHPQTKARAPPVEAVIIAYMRNQFASKVSSYVFLQCWAMKQITLLISSTQWPIRSV